MSIENLYPYIAAAAIFSILVFFFFAGVRKKGPRYAPALNGRLFTPVEWKFYQYLSANLPEGYLLFGKVRVSDIITPEKGLSKKEWGRAFSRITCKHIDFVIVDKGSGEVLAGVELNDSSHTRKDRVERDRFLRKAFSAAGVPLVFVPLSKGRWNGSAIDIILQKMEDEKG